jgi:hypothetical protein
LHGKAAVGAAGGDIEFVIASEAKQSRGNPGNAIESEPPSWIASSRSCHRAGHFGPDPLAPRNDESERGWCEVLAE